MSLRLKPRAFQLGFTHQSVMAQVRQSFFGAEAQRLQKGRDEVRVWVRLDERDRQSMGDLQSFRVQDITGAQIPLTEIADLELGRDISAINRLYGQREVQVSADLAGPEVSASDANAAIKAEVLKLALN